MDSRMALDRWKERWVFAQKTRQVTRKSTPTQTNHARDRPSPRASHRPQAMQKKVERENLFIQKDTSADGFLSHPKYMSGQKDPEQAKERFIKFDTYGDR
jgi:hypothetical protein